MLGEGIERKTSLLVGLLLSIGITGAAGATSYPFVLHELGVVHGRCTCPRGMSHNVLFL